MTAPEGDAARRSHSSWFELLQPLLLLALDLVQWRMASQVLHAQNQLRYLIDALLYLTLACVLLAVGLLSAVASLVLLLQPPDRALGLGLMAVACVVAAGLALRWLRQQLLQHLAQRA